MKNILHCLLGKNSAPFLTFHRRQRVASPTAIALLALCAGFVGCLTAHAQGTVSFSISDATVVEGNTGTTDMVFTVTATGASLTPVTVDYATADGSAQGGTTAVPPADYVSKSGTLSFSVTNPSQPVTQTIRIPVVGDTYKEANEVFFVNLSNPSTGATISDGVGVGTIQDDDSTPTISITDVSNAEGNSGTTNFDFSVTLSNPSDSTVTVSFATADGTATAPSDYQSASGTVTFNPGETQKTITVLVNGDTTPEPDETFTVNLSNPSNATISKASGTGTIQDDDSAATLSIDDVTMAEGDSGTKNFVFTVTKSGTTSRTVTVNYATQDGTAHATAGGPGPLATTGDYQSTSGTKTFAPGDTTMQITVVVNGDTANEGDEQFYVKLSGATNATVTNDTGTGTIQNDDATLSINDVSAAEGNSGTTSFTFDVTLNGSTSLPVMVNYATADGTATVANNDYNATSGTLTFSPGETRKQITVQVNGDVVNEPDETFSVNLSNPANAKIGDGQGVGTIQNDDGPPSFSINDVTQMEGNSGTTDFVFTVTKNGAPTALTLTVNYATQDGTATTADNDYVAQSGTLRFGPDETVKTISVPVNGDNKPESDETFTVKLSAANTGKDTGTGTIVDDDTVQFSIDDVTAAEGNSGATNFTFTVTKSGSTTKTTTVDYATADGSATTADNDYVPASGTLTFASGETTKTVTIQVVGDTTVEPNENFAVNLSNATFSSISKAQGVGTIIDDDSTTPAFFVSDLKKEEGNPPTPSGTPGTTDFVFTITKSGQTNQSVTINYTTADGTATSPSDYAATSGSLTFGPNDTVKTVHVPVVADAVAESDETFYLYISVPTSGTATIGRSPGTATILDDDTPAVTIDDSRAVEGDSGTTNMTFKLHLNQVTTSAVTVQYATADGTATAGSDYTASSGTVTWNAGDTSDKQITVPVIGDTVIESDETFFVNLSNASSNARISRPQATGTIVDDDGTASASIDDVTVTEGDSGTSDATFTVTLSKTSSSTITVDYATADGSATAGSDYTPETGSLSFSPGETSKTIAVPIVGDTTHEETESFTVNLSNPSNAVISKGQGTGTILDNDSDPSISIDDVAVTEGNSGTTDANFTITLSKASSSQVTVNYATADNTATAGSDYQSAAATITFQPGETSKQITVKVNGDTDYEQDETFFVNLSDATNASIADNQGVGTINNDDPQPSPTATPTPTPGPTASPTPTAAPSPTPVVAQNISTRALVEGGENVVIGGFIITGDQSKKVIIRGLGPSLADHGIANALSDPVLELHDKDGVLITTNDNWQDDAAQAAQIQASNLAPTKDAESALAVTLQPGKYTVVVVGKAGATGVGEVEIYDVDNAGSTSELANLSTRALVQLNDNVLIGGVILGVGNNTTNVIFRAIGPSLKNQGVSNPLQDPTLDIRDKQGNRIAFNDNWTDDPAQAAAITAKGVAPSDPHESAVSLTLAPGEYTMIVAGKDGGTGVGLVELYNTH